MNCKNCEIELKTHDNYCPSCGASVIKERITLKYLIASFFSALGWDERFLKTFVDLIVRPQVVFEKYLSGTRKKYTNPFTFFAIATTISVIIISFYFDDLVDLTANATIAQTELIAGQAIEKGDLQAENAGLENSVIDKEFIDKMSSFIFGNYYYMSFILLPLYAFIAFLVFGKPNNYAEHLVINTYIQGFLSIIGLLMFAIALFTNYTQLYLIGTYIITFLIYLYSYQKFKGYTFGRLLLKILRFFIVLIVLSIIFGLLSFITGILISIIKNR